MLRKKLLLSIVSIFCAVVLFYSFKNSTSQGQKVTLFRQYLSADADYGNFILITSSDGKVKKQLLLQNKHTNYEMNDKLFSQQLNELLATGLQIKHVTSSGDSHLTITTFILE